MTLRRNVLIFHSGALGDFILTWPLAVMLGRLLPQSRIFYVTQSQKGKLAEKVLKVDSADVEGGWHHLFAESPDLPPPAAYLLAGAQWIFTFVAAADSTWTRNAARLAPGAQFVHLSQAPPGTYAGHLTDYLVTQLKPWPPWQQGLEQMVRSIATRGVSARRHASEARPACIIHPGSGSPHKCWPADSYLELARRLAKQGSRPRVLLGEVEQECWPRSLISSFADAGDLRRPATLVDLWDTYTGALQFIGNDSGPGHLAAIMGVPTLSIFGPTDPQRWRPLGPHVKVLRKHPLESLAVDEVMENIQSS